MTTSEALPLPAGPTCKTGGRRAGEQARLAPCSPCAPFAGRHAQPPDVPVPNLGALVLSRHVTTLPRVPVGTRLFHHCHLVVCPFLFLLPSSPCASDGVTCAPTHPRRPEQAPFLGFEGLVTVVPSLASCLGFSSHVLVWSSTRVQVQSARGVGLPSRAPASFCAGPRPGRSHCEHRFGPHRY